MPRFETVDFPGPDSTCLRRLSCQPVPVDTHLVDLILLQLDSDMTSDGDDLFHVKPKVARVLDPGYSSTDKTCYSSSPPSILDNTT